MNTYEIHIHTENITDSATIDAESPEHAEDAAYEWFDIHYYDHHLCHEFSVEVLLVDNPDPAACYRCGGDQHPPYPGHVFMSNAEYGRTNA